LDLTVNSIQPRFPEAESKTEMESESGIPAFFISEGNRLPEYGITGKP